jgi:hypothetical protein
LSRWLADAKALGSPHLVTVLVGNKSDREEEREVEWSEASRWAAENGMSHGWIDICVIKTKTDQRRRCTFPRNVFIDWR